MLINISRKRFITPKSISASSCDPAYSSSIKTGKWKSASLSKPENEFLLFEFESELFFSYIEISSNPARKGAFPEDFRIDRNLASPLRQHKYITRAAAFWHHVVRELPVSNGRSAYEIRS